MNDRLLIKMTGITKRFPGVIANDNVNFDLRSGEIHSILGENGAGKTTLMNILAGMYQPDTGKIIIRDDLVHIRTPQDSLRFGIGMVYQHFTLIPNLTVMENLVLGFEGGFFLNLKKSEQKLKQISDTYGLYIDPQKKIQDLSVSERQRTEIIKVLFHGSDVLILDEPTSTLSPSETQGLLNTLISLRKTGKSVILITHNLSEALTVSDRITIMKSGKKVAELSSDALLARDEKSASDKILELMFGDIPLSEEPAIEKVIDNEPVLELKQVEALNSRGLVGLKRISFSVRKGEIFGLTGVDSEGQRILAEVIGGQRPVTAGKLLYRDQDITHLQIAKRFEMGISYITDDRINEGCVLNMKLSDNSILQSYYRLPFSQYGILNYPKIYAFTYDMIRNFGIQTTGPHARVSTLSGGNIQKFILARGLSVKPGLIVCNSPTYGLDAKTVRYIQELLRKESKRGTSVLLITSDMDELFSCSNRIGVLFNGEIIDIMNRDNATHEKVGKLMLGIRD
jgi:simple sugar transport system ATP-binding protein